MDGLVHVQWRNLPAAVVIACVEVDHGGRPVRDSKNPALMFTAAEWAAFTTGVRAGEFD